ncbi:MAG: phage shock protein operon transcriptional activator [Gammaproteobacteria bacterium]
MRYIWPMNELAPLVGEDPAFLEVIERVSRLAPLDRPCLVVGERGTGKELITSRLHYLSRRWEGPLLKVNCATLSETLLESELFGHEAGAFTGAQRRHIGRFERADGGTLVLDEIAVASPAVQEKVLRVIEYGEFERVGGSETLTVDVRVIGATNEDLPAKAQAGEFRADLLDRLAFDVITLPPLCRRPADILPLAHHFAMEFTRELNRPLFPGFSKRAEKALTGYPWPGNVRELRNVVERAVAMHRNDELPVDEILFDPFDSPWRPGQPENREELPDAGPDSPVNFFAAVADYERRLLEQALAAARYNQTRAAQLLEMSYHQLRRQIKKHNLSAGPQRTE